MKAIPSPRRSGRALPSMAVWDGHPRRGPKRGPRDSGRCDFRDLFRFCLPLHRGSGVTLKPPWPCRHKGGGCVHTGVERSRQGEWYEGADTPSRGDKLIPSASRDGRTLQNLRNTWGGSRGTHEIRTCWLGGDGELGPWTLAGELFTPLLKVTSSLRADARLVPSLGHPSLPGRVCGLHIWILKQSSITEGTVVPPAQGPRDSEGQSLG